MNRQTSLAVLLGAALLASCNWFDKTAVRISDINGLVPTARVKFNNFSAGSVGVDFFAGSTKMTAVLTSACSPGTAGQLPTVDSLKALCEAGGIESTTGTIYGGNAAGGLYMGIAPGSYALAAKKAATDTVISTVTQAIADGKYYSFFMSGIYNATTKTAEAFVVEDPIPTGPIDYTTAYVRLVNALPNGTGDLTLYATNTTTSVVSAVGTAVAYRAAGTFEVLPAGVYNFGVRYTGSGTNLISRSTLSLVGGRVYTVTSRGNTTTSATLGLDFTENVR